jgi:hypothetical protein
VSCTQREDQIRRNVATNQTGIMDTVRVWLWLLCVAVCACVLVAAAKRTGLCVSPGARHRTHALTPATHPPRRCRSTTHPSTANQSAPIDQQRINKLPPALTRRYDVYVHPEKAIPADPLAAGGAGGKASTHEHPITPLRRVAAEHIGKLVRIRVSEGEGGGGGTR